MPKLPDIEYSVTTQGPPNPAQAFGSLAAGVEALGEAGNRLSLAFAEEQAKSQISEASLIYEQGLAQDEAVLDAKPYLSRKVVEEALGGQVPPEVQATLDRHQDADAETIPTWEVGAAIHAASAKRLAEESAKAIYSPRAREEYMRRAAAESLSRNVRVNRKMLEQGAEFNAAKDISIAEALSRTAVSPYTWAKLTATVENSGWLSPAQKVQLHAKFAGLQATQGKQREAAGIAEGALGAGRDGLTPWVDAGKAQAAFEKSIQGKDPLVVEDARQRFTQALHQAETARQASDAPLVGRLETRIYQGGGLSRISPDYKALSPRGQAHVEQLAAAERRSSRSASLDEQRAQRELDAAAVLRFRALDLKDQVSVNPNGDDLADRLGDPEFAGVSRKARDAIAVELKGAKKAWQRDQGVSERDFMAEADDLAVRLNFKKKGVRTEKSELFEAYLRTAYRDWAAAQPEDGPQKPTIEQKNAMIRAALDYGDSGGWHMGSNRFRFQAKPGEKFTTEGFEDEQKGHRALEAAGIGAPKKVKVRRLADGVEGMVTNPDPSLYEVIP